MHVLDRHRWVASARSTPRSRVARAVDGRRPRDAALGRHVRIPGDDAGGFEGRCTPPEEQETRVEPGARRGTGRRSSAPPRLLSTGQIDKRIEVGDVGGTVCHVAEELNVDVIVVGSHGRTGLEPALPRLRSEHIVRHAHAVRCSSSVTSASRSDRGACASRTARAAAGRAAGRMAERDDRDGHTCSGSDEQTLELVAKAGGDRGERAPEPERGRASSRFCTAGKIDDATVDFEPAVACRRTRRCARARPRSRRSRPGRRRRACSGRARLRERAAALLPRLSRELADRLRGRRRRVRPRTPTAACSRRSARTSPRRARARSTRRSPARRRTRGTRADGATTAKKSLGHSSGRCSPTLRERVHVHDAQARGTTPTA